MDESIATSRAWSLRLAAIALVRALKSDSPPLPSTDLADPVLRLARAALKSEEGAAFDTLLTAVKWLVETDKFHGRSEAERRVAVELLCQSLSAEDPNTRSAAIVAIESIHDCGGLVELLGEDEVQEIRRWIRGARRGATVDLEQDLAAVELLVT